MKPLADKLRPLSLNDVVGQEHIIGEGKILNKIIENKHIISMIFAGQAGVGKTTVAEIIAKQSNMNFVKLNATNIGVKEIRDAIKSSSGKLLLFLDEIQNLSKKQQQSLLEFIESGDIILIASTTDNPYFVIYKALLSRCTVFEFKPLTVNNIVTALNRAINILSKDTPINIEEKVLQYIAEIANGDMRKALNILELSIISQQNNNEININIQTIINLNQSKILNYDRDGDSHYDILSAFHKSIRGSNPQASLHYLARLIKSGDLNNICRRLLCVAAEDVGLAYPQAISITKACVDSALQLGLPEGRLPLAEATILLANSIKSNSVITAIDSALSDLENLDTGDIPAHLKDGHYAASKLLGHVGYKYPHNYPHHYVKQQYLPDNIRSQTYYTPGYNKEEKVIEQYWSKLKGE